MDSDTEDELFIKKTQGKSAKKRVVKKNVEPSKKKPKKQNPSVKETKAVPKGELDEIISASHVEDKAEGDEDTIESIYCPACQAPLHYLKISPEVHAASCAVDWSKLPECPEGPNCVCDSIFHYRDFAHELLAEYRSSKNYISPRVKRKTQTKAKSKKTPGSSRKSLQKLQISEEVNDEAKEKVKRKLNLDATSVGSKKRKTKKSEAIVTEELKAATCESKLDDEELSYCKETQKWLFEALSTNEDQNKPSTSNGDPNFKVETKGVCSEHYIDPGVSSKKSESFHPESQSSNEDSILKSKPSIIKSESDCDNVDITNQEGKFGPQLSNEYKNPRFAATTDSQTSEFSWGSKIYSQPCSTPSESEAPDYLVKSLHVKKEIVDKDHNIDGESGLFENSQAFSSEFLQPSSLNSDIVKEECLSIDEQNCLASNVPSVAAEEPASSLRTNLPENPIISEICTADPFQFLNCDNQDEVPALSSDEEFERCFEKYDQDESLKECGAKLNSDDSSNGSSISNSIASSKNQENSKNLWKQILRPKAVPPNASISSSNKQKVFSKSRVIMQEAESEGKNFVEHPKRACPFYKKIPDTTFVVDAFNFGIIPGVTSYFLSHYHSDHYYGLRKSFNKPIYCSKITASLVKMQIGVKEEFLHVLNLREPRIINTVEVTALDANHCPGAFMFLFRLPDNRQFLHVGDFRACKEMESEPILRKAQIDALFLDTTYCNPRYTFPLQKDIIQMVVQVVEKKILECPDLLVVCGSYTIGKEKVFLGILEKFSDWKLWAVRSKHRVLNALENSQISSKLVALPQEAKVHVMPMREVNFQALNQHLSKMKGAFSHVLAFKPTGWEYGKGAKFDVLNPTSNGNITVCGVPYSEHSSYSELCRFTQFIAPQKVIPTVNIGNVVMRKKMMGMIDKWLQNSQSHKEQKLMKSFY